MNSVDVVGLILGGGVGSRLYPLTKPRAKPAVPIGGKYRLVDIPISNCLNSGINHIYILTQFNSVSLHRHISQTYKFDVFSRGWTHILAADQKPLNSEWYQGTADAVRKQLTEIQSEDPKDFLILAGDHLYRMDYAAFVAAHRQAKADISLAVLPVGRPDVSRFGIIQTDPDNWITAFHEKPSEPEVLDALATHADPKRPYLASMGVYVFRAEALYRLLETNPGSDFGKHILPASLSDYRVLAYPFDGYWEDIGTIRSFYESNLMLAGTDSPFRFYDSDRPIFSHPRSRFLPSSRVDGNCVLDRVLLAEGSRIFDSQLHRCVIGVRSIVGPQAHLSNTVMMGADYYEAEETLTTNGRQGVPHVGVGRGCHIESAIIDKNARIGDGVVIRGIPDREEVETDNYVARDGIVIVTKNAVLPAGTVI